MDNATPQPIKAFAVVATGTIAGDGDIVILQGADSARFPIPIFVHLDREVCERRKQSLSRRIGNIRLYEGASMRTSQPILGVVGVVLPAPKPRKEMSAEHKAKLAEGRDKGKEKSKSTVPLAPSVAGKK